MRFNKKTGKTGIIRRMATFVEYAMLVALMAILVAVGIAKFGKKITGLFSSAGKDVEEVKGNVDKATIEDSSIEP